MMSKLGRGQKDKVQQFMAITGASEKVALQALKASEWHLEGAFDIFYSQPQIRAVTDTRHLEELFKRYKGWTLESIKVIMDTTISCIHLHMQMITIGNVHLLEWASQNRSVL